MTVNDFFKRVSTFDGDKMMIFSDGEGWSNVNIEITNSDVVITCDDNAIFSDGE